MEQSTSNISNNSMSDNQAERRNKALVASSVACGILAIVGVGFGIWGINNNSGQRSSVEPTEQQSINSGERQPVSSQSATPQNDTVAPPIVENACPEATNPYESFSDNLLKTSSGSIFGENSAENLQVANIDENHHLTITSTQNGITTSTEDNNVLLAYYLKIGNGGVPYFYYIKTDGSVYRVCLFPLDNHYGQIEKVGDYTKIVLIFQGSNLAPKLVDIYGNVYDAS